MNVDRRSAIVTGGAGGLGAATVRRLVDIGMSVIVFDRDGDRARLLAKDLAGAAVAVGGDGNNDADACAAINTAYSLGTLALVVNVAGGSVGGDRLVRHNGSPHDKESFAAAMESHAYATFNIARLAAEAMAANEPDEHRERGVVVNSAALTAMAGQSCHLAYATANAAVLGMTLPMARDLAPIGIRVCAIAFAAVGSPGACAMRRRDAERIASRKEFALLVESIARNPHLNGENIGLDDLDHDQRLGRPERDRVGEPGLARELRGARPWHPRCR
jgi:NAD(P)-dependent dehydrogenase (short-subunit alcohol dehydrogenase family)